MKKKAVLIHLNERDRLRLDMMKEIWGVSLSAAIRLSIRAAAQKLGLEQEISDATTELISF